MSVRLLIVEDDAALRQMLTWELSDLGYQVVATGSCREAQGLAAAHSFDLALLDYQLPDGDGFVLLQALHRQHPQLPAVLCSALGCPEPVARAQQAGALQFVPKPASVALLHQLFLKALGCELI